MSYDRRAAMLKVTKERWERDVPQDRFWKRVNKNGPIPKHCPELGSCWLWDGARTKENYGLFVIKKRKVVTSRFSYEIHFGKIPNGILVCHRCDNPPCCNPNHLFAGTHTDNVRDCVKKGRNNVLRGSNSGFAKLDEGDVRTIFVLRKRGMAQNNIAKKFGVNQCNISRILNGKRWAHIR